MTSRSIDRLRLRIPPPVYAVVIALLMWAVALITPSVALPWPWRTGIAVVLVSAALSLGIAAVLSFRRAKTTIHPLNPSHTSAVVVAGVYRASRNPMYLAMLIGLVAISVILASPLALVLASGFVPLMNAVQVRPEERILADRFGDPYLEYCRQVRRWI